MNTIRDIERLSDGNARIAAYRALVGTEPHHAYAWSNLAVEQHHAGDLIGARTSLLRAAAIHRELGTDFALPPVLRRLVELREHRIVREVTVQPSQAIYEGVTAGGDRAWLRILRDWPRGLALQAFDDHAARGAVAPLAVARGTIVTEREIIQILEPLDGDSVFDLFVNKPVDADVRASLVSRIAAGVLRLCERNIEAIDLRPDYWIRTNDLARGVVYIGPPTALGPRRPDPVEGLGELLELAGSPALRALAKRCRDASSRPTIQQIVDETRALAESRPPTFGSGVRRVGGYTLLRVIGGGTFGTVYEGVDAAGRRAAVKVLHPHLATNAELRMRFQNEAEIAQTTKHPGIVHGFEHGESEGAHYFAMELVEGGSLARLLESGPLQPGTVAEIGIQIAEALEAMHAHRVIHRDLKPSNILVAERDAFRPTVKVCDFGIAKLSGDPVGMNIPYTRTGRFLGTPQYMAPEQWQMTEIDARTDIYALGAILYECLAGKPLFAAANEYLLQQAHLTAPPPALAVAPDAAVVEGIVRRMLDKDPARRPASMRIVADELRAWIRSRAQAPTRMEPLRVTPVTQEIARPRPNRRTWLALGLGALVLTGGLAAAIAIPSVEPVERDPVVVRDPKLVPEPDPRPGDHVPGHDVVVGDTSLQIPIAPGVTLETALARAHAHEQILDVPASQYESALEAALCSLDKQTLRLLRNAPYASYGVTFKSKDLLAFFYDSRARNTAGLPWTQRPTSSVDSQLSKTEKLLVRVVDRCQDR